LTVLLWVLLNFPAAPVDATMPAIDYSLAGRIGHALSVVFAPLGFNWQICIALIPGLAAREVAVSSLATVYALSAADDEAAAQALTPLISDGWSLATGLALLVWFIYAPQCIATWAAIKRETGSWKTMPIAAGHLFALAYLGSMPTYQVAIRLVAGCGGGTMPLWLQYVVVALVVLLALWMFLRRQFPGTVRRVRIAIAAPLVRD